MPRNSAAIAPKGSDAFDTTHKLAVQLHPSQHDWIRLEAHARGWSMAAVIRHLITEGMDIVEQKARAERSRAGNIGGEGV